MIPMRRPSIFKKTDVIPADHAKHLCAWHALGLMRELSDRKITGTKDSAFRVVTGLLYEAVSGQPDADLKRACDSVLQDMDQRSGTD
jgi:hypothetical protein